MAAFTTKSLEHNIESVSKIATTASKFGVLVGGISVVAYSLRIDHFPQDLSIGDGLLFVMTAACFGIIYILFAASLVSLGITLSPIIQIIFRLAQWTGKVINKPITEPVHNFAPFRWTALLFSLFSVIIIIALGQQNSTAYWGLPLLSIGLYFFYSIYISCGNKLRAIEAIKNSGLHTQEKEKIQQLDDSEKYKKGQIFGIASVLLLPLFTGGVSGQLLDAAMRMANVRLEKPIIYLKEPYSSLLSSELISKTITPPKEYVAFEGITVLFKGFGKTTVISFHDSGLTRKFEIPNDQLIIEKREATTPRK